MVKGDNKIILLALLGFASLASLLYVYFRVDTDYMALIIAFIAVNLACLLTLAYARLFAPFNLKVKTFNVKAPLAAKIVFISDAQLAGHFPRYLNRVINTCNSLNADLILWGGDLVEENSTELSKYTNLKNLKSKYGNFAVLGNHDYFLKYDPSKQSIKEDVVEFLMTNGFKVMLNSSNQVNLHGKTLQILGPESWWFDKHNFSQLKSAHKPNDFTILLTHEPALLLQLPADIQVDLALSGHTHNHQVKLPFVPEIKGMVKGKNHGWQKFGNLSAYVTSGIGFGDYALRLFTHPEIIVINLVPDNA